MASSDNQLRFPSPADVAHQRARELRRLSSSERFLRLMSFLAAGRQLLEASPKRDAALRLREENEEAWRRVQRELFARHVK